MNRKIKVGTVINILGMLAVITMNYLANALPINGVTTGELSNMYPNEFVPAGVTFSIWGIIYILLLIYVFAPLRYWNSASGNALGWLGESQLFFFFTILGNIGWLISWHHLELEWSMFFMLVLLVNLIKLYTIQRRNHITPWFFRWPVNVYLGWISVATIANVTVLLLDLGWKGGALGETGWALLVISVAFLLGMYFTLNQRQLSYSWVIVWAFAGILIKQQEAENPMIKVLTIFYIALLVSFMASLPIRKYLLNRD